MVTPPTSTWSQPSSPSTFFQKPFKTTDYYDLLNRKNEEEEEEEQVDSPSPKKKRRTDSINTRSSNVNDSRSSSKSPTKVIKKSNVDTRNQAEFLSARLNDTLQLREVWSDIFNRHETTAGPLNSNSRRSNQLISGRSRALREEDDDIIDLETLEIIVDRGVLRGSKPGSFAIGNYARRRMTGRQNGFADLPDDGTSKSDEEADVAHRYWEERETDDSEEDEDVLGGWEGMEGAPSVTYKEFQLHSKAEMATLKSFLETEARNKGELIDGAGFDQEEEKELEQGKRYKTREGSMFSVWKQSKKDIGNQLLPSRLKETEGSEDELAIQPEVSSPTIEEFIIIDSESESDDEMIISPIPAQLRSIMRRSMPPQKKSIVHSFQSNTVPIYSSPSSSSPIRNPLSSTQTRRHSSINPISTSRRSYDVVVEIESSSNSASYRKSISGRSSSVAVITPPSSKKIVPTSTSNKRISPRTLQQQRSNSSSKTNSPISVLKAKPKSLSSPLRIQFVPSPSPTLSPPPSKFKSSSSTSRRASSVATTCSNLPKSKSSLSLIINDESTSSNNGNGKSFGGLMTPPNSKEVQNKKGDPVKISGGSNSKNKKDKGKGREVQLESEDDDDDDDPLAIPSSLTRSVTFATLPPSSSSSTKKQSQVSSPFSRPSSSNSKSKLRSKSLPISSNSSSPRSTLSSPLSSSLSTKKKIFKSPLCIPTEILEFPLAPISRRSPSPGTRSNINTSSSNSNLRNQSPYPINKIVQNLSGEAGGKINNNNSTRILRSSSPFKSIPSLNNNNNKKRQSLPSNVFISPYRSNTSTGDEWKLPNLPKLNQIQSFRNERCHSPARGTGGPPPRSNSRARSTFNQKGQEEEINDDEDEDDEEEEEEDDPMLMSPEIVRRIFGSNEENEKARKQRQIEMLRKRFEEEELSDDELGIR